MTGRHRDTETSIREWLTESAPSAAPPSLRRTLQAVTSGPARPARRRFVPRPNPMIAGRMVAVAAIAAIAVSTLYLYGQGRSTAGPSSSSPSISPSASRSPSPTPADTVTSTATETPTPTSTPLSATVTQLPGSSWSLVSWALPFTTQTTAGAYQQPIFALPSGGFVAIMPTAAGGTRVFESTDGLSWHELAALPTNGAVVSHVIESRGLLVAVGLIVNAGKTPTSASVWTFDGRSWDATELSQSDGSMADHIADGPAGFLVGGVGPSGFKLWSSTDGSAWKAITQSGIPSDVNEPEIIGNARGYVAVQLFQPRVWHSTDGTNWTETYHAPALSGISSYYMGALIKAPDGSFRSFGGIYTGTGIASPALGDTWIWTSPDMTHWTISGSIKSPGWINEVVPVPAGFVAAGNQPTSAGRGLLEAWTSRDGVKWQRLNGLPSLQDSLVLEVVGDGTHAVIAFVDAQDHLELLVGAGLK